jgi:toxin YoeB
MRIIEFKPLAAQQFDEWAMDNEKIHDKILQLFEACLLEPFSGIGKPEALKHNLKGCWSRRITKEHRLINQVTSKSIIVISCKFHY